MADIILKEGVLRGQGQPRKFGQLSFLLLHSCPAVSLQRRIRTGAAPEALYSRKSLSELSCPAGQLLRAILHTRFLVLSCFVFLGVLYGGLFSLAYSPTVACSGTTLNAREVLGEIILHFFPLVRAACYLSVLLMPPKGGLL